MVTVRRCVALAVVCALTLGAGCRRSVSSTPSSSAAASESASISAFPLDTIDDAGHPVRVEREPLRIVALLPSLTETVFALGAGEHVVGVDDFSDYPSATEHLPRLGGSYDVHIEQLLSLSPDLVLLSKDSMAAAPLVQNGVQIWAGDARSFSDVFRVIEAVGALLGRAARAKELTARMHADLSALEAKVSAAPRVSVYYELDPTPYSVGPGSFIGVLLEKAGGRNVVPPALGDFPKLNPELIVAADPQVILGAAPRDIASRAGWSQLSAVKSGRAHALTRAEAHLVARPGPRLARALELLIHQLHPELG